jgi:YihY family inner membrane protein
MVDRFKLVLERLKANRLVATVLAVNSRYGADGGGYLSAALTYFGFLSLFPLILVALSAVGFVLAHDPHAQTQWAARLAGSVPGLGTLVGRNIGAVVAKRTGAGIVGVLGLLWSGTALTNAGGYSLSRVYRRPEVRGFVKQKVWSLSSTAGLGLLALAGVGVAGSFGGVHARGWLGMVAGIGAVIVAFALDFVLFLVSYRVLSAGSGPSFSTLWPGAVLAAAGWTALKVAGSWYASRTVAHASQVYGTFGTVVGVLALLYLASRLFLYGAELNVVLEEHRGGTMKKPRGKPRRGPRARRAPAPIAGGAGVPASEREAAEQSTGELLSGIAADLGTLVRKEMELARHEIVEALVARMKSAAALATAGVFGLVALVFGALAVADLLHDVLPLWLSRGVVCVAFGFVALAALVYGGKKILRPPLAPVETKRTVKEEVQWARAQLKR